MKRVLSMRWFRVSAGLVLVLLIVLLSCAWYYQVWSWRDLQVYRMMSRECHPVWQELHRGRLQAGQDVEDVIVATKPARVERYGVFVRLNYQEGLALPGSRSRPRMDAWRAPLPGVALGIEFSSMS